MLVFLSCAATQEVYLLTVHATKARFGVNQMQKQKTPTLRDVCHESDDTPRAGRPIFLLTQINTTSKELNSFDPLYIKVIMFFTAIIFL